MLAKNWIDALVRNADGAGGGAAAAAAAGGEGGAAAQGDGAKPAETVLYGDKPADGAKPDAKADGAKPADGKPAEGDKKADGEGDKPGKVDPAELAKVPEDGKYVFTLKEGLELDAALADRAMPVLKDAGITREQANKLAGFLAESREAEAKALSDHWEETNTKWIEAAKTDKEFGGDKFDVSLAKAQGVLNKFGTPELKEYLTASGGGNHPELIRFMARVGNAFSDDKPVGSETPAAPKSAADVLYGSTT